MISSPCAKLVSPVVPKISDRPSERHGQQQREHDAADGELQGLGRPCRCRRRLLSPIGKDDEDVGVERDLEGRARSSSGRPARCPRAACPVDLDRVGLARGCRWRCPGAGCRRCRSRRWCPCRPTLPRVVLDGDRDVGDRCRRLLAVVGQAALDVDGCRRRAGRASRRSLEAAVGAPASADAAPTATSDVSMMPTQRHDECGDASGAGVHGAPRLVVVGTDVGTWRLHVVVCTHRPGRRTRASESP